MAKVRFYDCIKEKGFFFRRSKKKNILIITSNFSAAFLHIFLTCRLNLSFLSTMTPTFFSSKFHVARPPTCWKFDSCLWVLRKNKSEIKANLLLNLFYKFTELFSYKNIFQTASRIFFH